MDYFTLLGLPPTFDFDLKLLEQCYFTQQRLYHPDKFVKKSPEERQLALLRSVEINAAYETLKKPLSCAQYLLHLQGIEVGTDRDTVKPSQAILMEAMELREEQKSEPVLQAMIGESTERIAAYYRELKFDAMAQETLRLGYLMKAREQSK